MDQDYIRSRYAGEATPPPTPPASETPPAPQPSAGEVPRDGGFHIPHPSFGGGAGDQPWYESRWGLIAFAVGLGPIVGIFVWWVITRYDLEYRTKLMATGLSVALAVIVSLLL